LIIIINQIQVLFLGLPQNNYLYQSRLRVVACPEATAEERILAIPILKIADSGIL
jgi:hypothetical protein